MEERIGDAYSLSLATSRASRNRTITAKITQADLERIENLVSELGVSKSQFIREAVMAVVELIEAGGCSGKFTAENFNSLTGRIQRICQR